MACRGCRRGAGDRKHFSHIDDTLVKPVRWPALRTAWLGDSSNFVGVVVEGSWTLEYARSSGLVCELISIDAFVLSRSWQSSTKLYPLANAGIRNAFEDAGANTNDIGCYNNRTAGGSITTVLEALLLLHYCCGMLSTILSAHSFSTSCQLHTVV